MFNPYISGWINYYGHFYKSALLQTLRRIDAYLIRWGRYKYKRLRARTAGARDWFARVVRAHPALFCPLAPAVCRRPNIGSRVTREGHVRLCVQRRLACSAGNKPAGVEVRAP